MIIFHLEELIDYSSAIIRSTLKHKTYRMDDIFNSKPTPIENVRVASLSPLVANADVNEAPIHDLIGHTLLEQMRDSIHTCEGSTFFVNLDEVLNQYLQWFEYLPRIKPFYGKYVQDFHPRCRNKNFALLFITFKFALYFHSHCSLAALFFFLLH